MDPYGPGNRREILNGCTFSVKFLKDIDGYPNMNPTQEYHTRNMEILE